MICEHWLLLNDAPSGKFPGIVNLTNAKQLPRGELLSSMTLGGAQQKYYVDRDPTITFNVTFYDDIAPVTIEGYQLLRAIESRDDRYQVFADPTDWFEWGMNLKVGSQVYVHLPGPSASESTQSSAIVRYKGDVVLLPGTTFGVEITVCVIRC